MFGNSQTSMFQDKLQSLEHKVNNMKLMYRSPGSDTHENITQALDKLFNKLDNIEERLSTLEDLHYDCGK